MLEEWLQQLYKTSSFNIILQLVSDSGSPSDCTVCSQNVKMRRCDVTNAYRQPARDLSWKLKLLHHPINDLSWSSN